MGYEHYTMLYVCDKLIRDFGCLGFYFSLVNIWKGGGGVSNKTVIPPAFLDMR